MRGKVKLLIGRIFKGVVVQESEGFRPLAIILFEIDRCGFLKRFRGLFSKNQSKLFTITTFKIVVKLFLINELFD